MLFFSIPAVQTWSAKKATSFINKKYETNISIEKINLGFTGNVNAKNVFIKDTRKDTLILAKNVSTSVVSFANIYKGNTLLSDTSLDGVRIKMITYEGEDMDSFRTFIQRFTTSEKKEKPFYLALSTASLTNASYLYVNENISKTPIVDIKYINLLTDKVTVNGANVDFHTNAFSFLYKNHINVENFITDFKYEPGAISLKNIELVSENKTNLQGDFLMTYKSGDMSDFYNRVAIKAKINNSKVSTTDLRLFYNEFGKNKLLNVSTNFNGVLNDFTLTKLKLNGLSNSAINGDLRLWNSMSKTKLKDFKVSGKVTNLSTNKKDLSGILPNVVGKYLPVELDKFGTISALGNLTATPSSVDFKGDIKTNLGDAVADIFLDNLLSENNSNYKGALQIKDFDLKSYTGNPNFGKTDFNVEVDGRGFLLNDLDTYIIGDFFKIQYKGYDYKNIGVSGILKYPFFDGKIVAKDPNCDLNFEGLANLKKKENDFNFKAEVNKINLNKLNLFTRDSISIFTGTVIANFKGTTIDDVYGTIHFKNTSYINQNEIFSFKDFQLNSKFSDTGERSINVNSPEIIQGQVTGKFRFKNIKNLFQNSLASLYKNYEAEISTENEYLKFDLKIYNKIIDVFYPEINLGANTRLIGNVDSDGSKFNLDFNSPNITYKNNEFKSINLKVDNSSATNTLLSIEKLKTTSYNLSAFNLVNVNKNDTLFSNATFKGGAASKDSFNLKLYHTINKFNNSVVGIKKSSALINNNEWFVNTNNDLRHKIEFDNNFNDYTIDSIEINHNNERITFNGVVRDSTYKDIRLKFSEVDLRKISKPVKNLDYTGIVNGGFNFLQKNKIYLPTSDLKIKDFTINDLLIGDVALNAAGNNDLTNYFINAEIARNGKKSFNLEGLIDASSATPTIDFDVAISNFDLEPFSNLGGIVLSNLRGQVYGEARIKGDYSNPDINGALKLKNAGLLIPYLNVDLNVKDGSEIELSNKEFKFLDASITDTKYQTKGVLSGIIAHDKFKKWDLDLAIKSNRLLVLNTTEKDNELYYGTAFINGGATIKGPTDQLKIVIDASSAEGTKFKIPISDTETIGDNSFIHFITPEEKLAIKNGNKVYFEDVKGLELEFDLDLNKFAEVEVVIDKESGSTLKGYGAGTLLIQINTNGKFNMWGDFVAYQGTYDFKYGGVVSKRFDVRTGNISWDGSPTAAKLDLSAVYQTNANPNILLENSVINRKIPVEVITTLTGELLKPDLNFNIDFPNASSIIKSELDFILSDRTIKERQAFSLITQGQFYSDALIGNNLITGNLVEKASDLVSSIFSDEEDKFDIGFNYNPADRTNLDNQISDEFGVSVSTQISKRILINGKVGIPVGGVTESVVVGDVRIDFLLNEDGTLRANIFNRENDLQFIGEANGYTQGVGLSYSYDFNTFKELLREIFSKQKNDKKN